MNVSKLLTCTHYQLLIQVAIVTVGNNESQFAGFLGNRRLRTKFKACHMSSLLQYFKIMGKASKRKRHKDNEDSSHLPKRTRSRDAGVQSRLTGK